MPISQQPPCADWHTVSILGKQVQGTLIESIPFQFQRNLLLLHENGLADLLEPLTVTIPVGPAYAEIQAHSLDCSLGIRLLPVHA
jgi:hypothetical protein